MLYRVLTGVMIAASLSLAASDTASKETRGLDARQRNLVPIAAFTALGDLPRLEVSLEDGLDSGLTINEIKEALFQMYAYAGFPRSLNGLGTFQRVLDRRKARGKTDPPGAEPSSIPAGTSLALGTKIQSELLGGPAVGGYVTFAPAIDTLLKAHLFGDLFGRGVLDYRMREIATVAALASLRDVSPQLRGHFQVARNVGVTQVQIEEILDVLKARVDPAQAELARSVLSGLALATAPSRIAVTPRAAHPPVPGGEHFTGKVEVAQPFRASGPSRYYGAEVSFQPAARTAWHRHPLGQMLIVTSGTGFVQAWGDTAQMIQVGDVVWIPPDEKHWHGAAPDRAMTHIAITEPLSGSATEWMEAVGDKQYTESSQPKQERK